MKNGDLSGKDSENDLLDLAINRAPARNTGDPSCPCRKQGVRYAAPFRPAHMPWKYSLCGNPEAEGQPAESRSVFVSGSDSDGSRTVFFPASRSST